VLAKPDVASKLRITLLRLDIESASELRLSMNIRHRQWDAVAQAENALLPDGECKNKSVLLGQNTI
jgi:hypothetical protein